MGVAGRGAEDPFSRSKRLYFNLHAFGFAIYFTYGWRNSVLIENYGEAGPLLREKGIDYVAEGLTFSSDGNVNAAFSPDTNQNESKD
ncbi:unnamed protein product [Protopolystoma xenopodis]|uniref:Uncharacterized protein n=1 Tax=Protopolystoma xenopodis TaxID=117903 RepID=A0A448WVL1_9PLAT|nr:unnamed protein product [Protopolystoma xenopodis]